jgi:hypothetical protein
MHRLVGPAPAAWGRVVLLATLLLSACGTDDPGQRVLAEAYGEKLWWSDLRPLVPVDADKEDSAAIVRRYVDNWARDQVMLHMAQENLDLDKLNVEARIKDYRGSLITFAYEQALVEQNLDTVVSQAEVQDYYGKNLSNFQLKDNMVRVRWFKLRDEDTKLMKQVESLWRSPRDEDRSKLEVLLARHGATIVDSHDQWVPFKDLQAQVPPEAGQSHGLVAGPGQGHGAGEREYLVRGHPGAPAQGQYRAAGNRGPPSALHFDQSTQAPLGGTPAQ